MKNFRYSFGIFSNDVGLFSSFDGYESVLCERIFTLKTNKPLKCKIDVCRKDDKSDVGRNRYKQLAKIFL